MSVDEPLVGAIQRMEAVTAPSIQTVRMTFVALQHTVDSLSADCRAISETLEALGDALNVITQGDGLGQEFGGFGVIGLPIAGAMRAVKGVASQYLKEKTGIPLNTWTDLVASSSSQFSEYLSQLDTVAQLAQRYHATAAIEISAEQAEHDLEILLDVRWRSQAWKQILSRVAQLGQVVDVILQAKPGGEPGTLEADGPERSAGFAGSLQRRIKDVQARTVEKTGDLQQWVLQPFHDVRDRVKQLPEQTSRLAHEVALLEILLELEIAGIRVCAGQISATEARIVGIRVAASVILPEIGQRLADARRRAVMFEAYLDRLNRAHNARQVSDRAYSILSEEYRTSLQSGRSLLAELDAQADVWRRDGRAVLDACAEWTTQEMEVLAARRLAEQNEAGADRRILLQRERDRLDEARNILASL